MRCCTNRPNTWMHPTGAHQYPKTSCTARAVHPITSPVIHFCQNFLKHGLIQRQNGYEAFEVLVFLFNLAILRRSYGPSPP